MIIQVDQAYQVDMLDLLVVLNAARAQANVNVINWRIYQCKFFVRKRISRVLAS